MNAKLGEMAIIQMGYSFRSRIERDGSGSVGVIQMKDLTDENLVDPGGLTRVDLEPVPEHHRVRTGDLVFRSRGQTFSAAIVAVDPGPAVVAAPLFRIRVADPKVLPEYLQWFINQPPSLAFLASRAKGTAQKMIDRQALEDLEIVVPPVERQRAVVELAALAEREKSLMEKLARNRYQYVSAILMRRAEGEGNR